MQTFAYPLSGIVSLFALSVYFVVTLNVARARVTYNVPAPQTSGPDEFLRYFRVHMNTLEQMALFLPLLWLAATSVNDGLAAAVGICWPVGRIIYARAYYRDPAKRAPGFIVGMATCFILAALAVTGVLSAFIGSFY
ncbi:MAG: MAPEG family protein [Alphaproteobacteria bacterium]